MLLTRQGANSGRQVLDDERKRLAAFCSSPHWGFFYDDSNVHAAGGTLSSDSDLRVFLSLSLTLSVDSPTPLIPGTRNQKEQTLYEQQQ